MLFNSFFGRKNTVSSTSTNKATLNKKNRQPRHFALEPLESRDLLTVTMGEPVDDAVYNEIRAAYPDFELSEYQSDLNVITITPEDDGSLLLSDLQAAIYAAGESDSPDLILVMTSADSNTITYTSAADELAIDISSDSVTIIGWGPENLTLNANQQSRVMIISDSSTVNLGGLTITGGNSSASLINSETYGEYAGGIGSLGTLTIENCTITGNTASGYGGGIASSGTLRIVDSLISNNTTTGTDEYSGGGGIASSGDTTIINSEISNNEAASGAGIINSEGTLLINESVISHNTATSEYSSGGGIVNSEGSLVISNSVISYNEALNGGGVYSLGMVEVIKSEIINNTATGIGGGICNDYGTCMVISSTVSGNRAEECGGGIYCWWEDCSLTVMSSEISGNESPQGGGIFNKGVIYVYSSTISENIAEWGGGVYNSDFLTVTNCTIAGNALIDSLDAVGNGIYSSGASAINNSIIVDAIYNDNEAGTITGSYNLSDYSGWSADSYNIAYDSTQPLFVDAANGDYHLAAGSQAIDRGDNALAVDADGAALTNDQSGRLRINNDVVDIGAHEYKESISDYSAIRTKYAELELPESEYDVNIIVVDLTAGDGLAELHAAIATAGMTLQDDLIVVYTSDDANTLTYSDNEDALVIETDADDFGSVTLVSWGDSDLTIDANQVDSGIYVYDEYTDVNLGGLTFVNAYTGVYNEYGTVSVAQCEFSGNYTGIYNDYGVFSISDCSIKNSENNGILNYSGKLTVASSVLSQNAGFRGGAICNDLGIVTITDSLISDNTAQDGGGAIYNGGGTITILNSEILNNKSNSMGGAIYNSGYSSNGTFTILNSKISGNQSYMGGAINCSGGTLTVMNSEISDNIANSDGGGILGYFEKVLLTNSVIAGNTAIYGGGSGIYAGSGSITVTNCTIAGNSSQYGGSGFYNNASTTINNSIIVDDIVNEDSYGIIAGSNNLSAYSGWSDDSYNIAYNPTQPLFLDADNGDYHLTDGAVAIDAGNNDLAVDAKGVALAYDLDGAPRISNGTVDIGAYEYSLDSSTLARPVLSTPIFEDDGSVTVSWSNVNNASGYLFEYKLTSDADWTSIDLTEQSFSLDLPDGQAYKVRVMAYSNGDYNNSEFSSEKLIFNYDDIREKYSTFDLPESKDNINIIVVDLTAGDNLAKLKKSVQKAVETAQEDLIVVLTSNDANTLKYTNSTDMLMFEDYSGTSYPITVISLGDSNLTIDANHLCRAIAVGSGIDVNLGGLTITNGYNSMDDGSAIANYGWLKISYSTITGNYTPNCGAILNGNDGGLIVTNSLISDNVSETSGGGIYNFGFTLVTNSVITDNSSNYGGGICNTSNLSVINSTIAANVAANEGAGIYNSGISLYADNSIIVDEIVNSYGDIAGNNNLSTFTGWAYGDDNLSYDPSKPLFVNAANGDYHLAAGSQAIDNGNNDAAIDLYGAALEVDMDGNARIVNGTVDIGAYEYQGGDEPIVYSSVVTTLNDSFDLNDDEWSLREAIYYAPEYVTITFADDLFADGPQTITLTQGELAIRKALVIDGGGLITIDANQASRVFNVTAGTEEQPVVLDGLTIQNGDTEDLGGGILVTDGYLVLDNCLITENSASLGGGIATDSFESISQLVIKNSTVSHNTSENSGGGIYSYGSLTIIDSSISDNTTRGDYCDGGGISYFINDPIVEATFTITNSSITGNTAYSGGGIRYSSNSDSNATFFTITDSVISGNSAKSEGGISCESAVLTVTNCDISDNASDSGVGGGIAKFGGTLTVTNSTIVGNKAIEGSGGGICSYDAVVTITDSVISGNSATMGGGIFNESGAVTIVNSVISENESEDDGAGISSYCGSVTIISSAISRNTGSGIYCLEDNLTIIDSKITENNARYGAGIRIEDGGDISIVNSLIANNIAENRGGAIYNHYGALTITNSTIAGNKVTCAGEHSDNDEYTEGGGIYNWGTVTFNSYNSIIACNTYCGADSDIYTSPVDSEGAVVNGYNSLSSYSAWDNAVDSDNFVYDSTKPLFVDAANGDYHLAAGSQAIDRGNNDLAVDEDGVELEFDMDGNARISGKFVDIGAYEYVQPEVDYNAIRSKYSDFDLPESEDGINIIVVDLTSGNNLNDLKTAISTAGGTTLPDLIVVCTSDDYNTLRYTTTKTNEMTINIDAEQFGAVTIVSWGPENFTLNANQKSRVMTVYGASTILNLGGMTITGGNSSNSASNSNYGGGILNMSSTLTISDCTITGNASTYGGGLFSYDSSTVKIIGSAFSGNSATTDGGGIYGGQNSNVTVTDCTVSGNSATYGAGIYNGSGITMTVNNCQILDNSATTSGGGLFNTENSTLIVTDSVISGNKGTTRGGGFTNYYGNATFTNSEFTNNTGNSGGGIYNGGSSYNSTLTVTDSDISENSSSYGGGIYNSSSSNFTVTNSEISGNTASNYGGGIINYGDSLVITNSTIAGNSSRYGGGIDNNNKPLTVTNSIISSNYSIDNLNIASPNYATNNHNLIGSYYGLFVKAPMFDSEGNLTNADTMDLHLRTYSAAIDAGDNDAASGLVTDIDGKTRIYGDIVDIGAYEYQGDRDDKPIIYSSVVNTLNDSFDPDDDEWSLREAICYATEYVTITFADNLNGTIELTQGQLTIDKPLAIDGDGRIVIDANQNSRVLAVSAGTSDNPVVLNGLTIQNGVITNSGGGILNSGTLIIINCTISGNSARDGGGIYTDGEALTVVNCTIAGNSAAYIGGGIYAEYETSLSITNSIVTSNYANYYGVNISANNLDETSHHNLINSYYGLFVIDPVFDSEGNLTNAAAMDLHLRSDSNAIDAGDNTVASGLIDVEGKARIFGGTVDIGAYEYQGDRNDDPIPYSSVVTTLDDSFDPNDNEWSLREAIYYAPEYVTITFADNLDGTILLERGQLVVDKALVIDGAGRITIDADHINRVILVEAGTSEKPVVLNGLTIQNGGNDSVSDGGGIYNNGALAISNCAIIGNSAGFLGGGICNTGFLSITNAVIEDNLSDYGGGIASFGTLTITNSDISYNTAFSSGGAIENGGVLLIVNSAITDNIVLYTNFGGGIANFESVSITNCTIAGNSTSDVSNGIYNSNTLTVNNSIIADGIISEESDETIISGSNNLSTFTGWASGTDNQEYDPEKPLFVNAARGNYRLAKDSQAIDKGNDQLAHDAGLDESSTDLANRPRFVGDFIDIGAYEFNASYSIDFVGAVSTQFNVYNDTNAIPDSVSQLTDWDRFYLELWTADVSEFESGDSFETAVNYNPKFHQLDLTQTIVTPNGVTAEIADQTIEDDGSVTVIIILTVSDSGYTAPGSNTYWGSVLFTPSTAEGSGVDDQFAQETLGVSVNGVETETMLIAMPYDFDNDNVVDVDDFVAFASVYGYRPSSFNIDDQRYAQTRQADFDGSGVVDVNDFVAFATNFGFKKGQNKIVLPTRVNAAPAAPAQTAPNELVIEEQTTFLTPAPAPQNADIVAAVPAVQEPSSSYLMLAQPTQTESVQTLRQAHSSALLDLFDNQNEPASVSELSVPAIDEALNQDDEFDFLFDDSNSDSADTSDVDLSVVLDELELVLK